MSNLDASDLLDGSDVDEDNVGDVDQDVENVLLGSDDDEITTAHHHVTTRGNKFSYTDGGGRHSEEEDVLNLGAEGEEEPLDFEADAAQEGGRRVPPVQLRNSAPVRELDHGEDRLPSCSSYDENMAANEDFSDRRYVEEDDYEDDEEEDRTTRSRFTSERNVESFNTGHMSGSSNSVGIPIQTVGDRNKIKPGVTEGRPKHWNHHNGPRHMGPRHPGRNHRFPHPPRSGPGEHLHMRGNVNQPIVQFNEGLFTDFNQPMRHPHPRLRLPPPGRFEGPRHQEMGPHHRHPMHLHDPNNMRPNFGPHHNRPFFPPNENRFGPPRHPPGNMIHPQHQSPPVQPRPDFNLRGPRPPRFSPNNFNHRSPRPQPPQQAMHGHPNPQMERPPFPPRQHHPHYDAPPPSARDLPNNRPPNPQGFPPPPHNNGPPGYAHPNINPGPPRFMGHPRPPMEAPHMSYYNQEQQPNYHHGPEPAPSFHHEAQWNGPSEPMPLPNPNSWMHQQQQQPNFGGPTYNISSVYDQTVHPQNSGMIYSGQHVVHQANHPQMSLTLHASHQMDIPSSTKTIYIKPNSELHEAISKGELRHHIKDDDRRYHESASSSKHYDDHYRDREHRDRDRSVSSRRESSPSDRRRDGDYHDERRSYHQHEDKRPRRKYEDDRTDRRHRSESPDKKMSRSDRQQDIIDRNRIKEKEADKKEADKLLEEAKKMGLGEDYVKKLEEQRKLRERILKTKEQRRKQVKVPTDGDVNKDSKNLQSKDSSQLAGTSSKTMTSNLQKGSVENAKEIEADSTVATAKSGKPKKILRIVRDKSGKIISKKVHVVLMAKPQQEGQQSTSTS